MAADESFDNARTRVVDSGAPLALANGTLLGRYRIDGVLGQGGFGITYRATDTALNRVVAIKEYLPSDVAIRVDGTTVIPRSRTDASDYDWGLKRFLDEAKTLAQHEAVPNVVRVYDFVEANGTAYMVMALVEGENLSTILRDRGTLTEQELRAIVLPLLDGLEQLHEAGVIHRDIKPSNIILRGGRTPTLIDFGAAREGLGRKSRSVTSILTPGYAPFEQYGSAGDQGPWTDIYAMAATLYHGVAGKPPPDSVDRIRRDPMVPAVQAGAGRYGEAFLAAIDAGLKVDERERPQNSAAWRALFDAVAAPTITPVAVPVTMATAASAPVAALAPMPRPAATIEPAPPPSILAAPPVARSGSRSKLMIAAAAAVLVVGGGVVAALSMGGSSSKAPEAQPIKSDSANVQIAAVEKQRVEAEQRRAAELEKRLAEEETRRKTAEEARAKVEADVEARRKAEEEARRKAAEDARLKAEAEAREKAEAESRRRIEEETRKKVEAEFKAKTEEDAKKRKVEEEAQKKVEEARLKAEEAKRKADEARQKVEDARAKVEQKTGSNTQVAAAAPPADPAAYVAQHWPAMRAQAERALKARGDMMDPASGQGMPLRSVNSYQIVSVTAAAVTLRVSYTIGRSAGNLQAHPSETMVFRNEAPAFPLIAAGEPAGASSASAAPAQSQVAAAPAPAPADPATYVAQHWATSLRPKIEAALRKRGTSTDTVTGGQVTFDQIFRYQVISVTSAQIVVTVTYRNAPAIRGGSHGNNSITTTDIVETATFINQPPDFPLVSVSAAGRPSAPQQAPASTAPSQVAAAPAQGPTDPAAYVAQHWPTSLRPKIEAALRQRGIFTDPISGGAMRFDQIYNYRVVQVTAAQIVLSVTYRNIRAAPGGGNMSGTTADATETATFQNQAPEFLLIGLK